MREELSIFQNFIFDMDGTLVDSSSEVLFCLRKACESVSAEINEANFTPNVIGPPLKEIIKSIIVDKNNEELVANVTAEFRHIYDNDENDKSSMYEGAYQWLLSLKSSGKKLFLATYKPTIPTRRLMKKLNLDMFEDIYTIDKYEGRVCSKCEMISEIVQKYGLKKPETVMVGDAPSDIISAHDAGVKAIGALWGYGNHREILLKMSDFTFEISDLKVLQKI